MSEVRWHRFRHYDGRWSNFDQIERCNRPGKFCCGCEFKHPFCDEAGRVEAAIPVGRPLTSPASTEHGGSDGNR